MHAPHTVNEHWAWRVAGKFASEYIFYVAFWAPQHYCLNLPNIYHYWYQVEWWYWNSMRKWIASKSCTNFTATITASSCCRCACIVSLHDMPTSRIKFKYSALLRELFLLHKLMWDPSCIIYHHSQLMDPFTWNLFINQINIADDERIPSHANKQQTAMIMNGSIKVIHE